LTSVELESLVLRALGLTFSNHGVFGRCASGDRRLGTLAWRYRGLALVASASSEHEKAAEDERQMYYPPGVCLSLALTSDRPLPYSSPEIRRNPRPPVRFPLT
jgi:hypothetical protein